MIRMTYEFIRLVRMMPFNVTGIKSSSVKLKSLSMLRNCLQVEVTRTLVTYEKLFIDTQQQVTLLFLPRC